jgi:hypothetical protein
MTLLRAFHIYSRKCTSPALFYRHLEIRPVTLSAAKGLARRAQRSFAALRMTARIPLQSAYGKSYLQTSDPQLRMILAQGRVTPIM